jgi:hypothetical protein
MTTNQHDEHGQTHHQGAGSTTPAAAKNMVKPGAAATAAGTLYTCPMHAEIRQDHPGNCPKCGMVLEPVMPALGDDDNPELRDFQRRFWWTLPFSAVVFVLAMVGHRGNLPLQRGGNAGAQCIPGFIHRHGTGGGVF